ncbi:MAG: ferredoxin--NADP reductase [Chitinophagaceae bacterium]|nr:ferredoxin--NADP reductase [Chitinophagaceae bacterium]MCW5926485.1 ferredoxin--NADP reductase [Chitinophagaceae bacterium]
MSSDFLSFTITDIVQETDDVATFVLKSRAGKQASYRPGQFITLVFNRGRNEVRRSYSLSSTPHIDESLQFTVKRIRNGEISRRLLDNYKKGDVLHAISPAGMFVYEDDNVGRDVFLLAAGSGITPVFSILKHILHFQPQVRVHLIYQNNTEQSTIFRSRLEELEKEFADRFTWIDYLSNPTDNALSRNKLTNDQLELLIHRLLQFKKEDALFYICGPLSFMRMCQFTILLMRFNNEQIKKEYFVIDTPPAPPLVEHPSVKEVVVVKRGRKTTFYTIYPSTILQSALDRQLDLPYSCKGGRCSACVARCIRGEVVMSMNDVLTEKDIEQGLVLTCVGYAVSDVELIYE